MKTTTATTMDCNYLCVWIVRGSPESGECWLDSCQPGWQLLSSTVVAIAVVFLLVLVARVVVVVVVVAVVIIVVIAALGHPTTSRANSSIQQPSQGRRRRHCGTNLSTCQSGLTSLLLIRSSLFSLKFCKLMQEVELGEVKRWRGERSLSLSLD